ncbi:hypothetical protein GLOTRDRAFT_113519 [Gloeophyllum trabeum ATCC 11539]|uniref:Uncharacterized protein n=1 Tax=Gloeophyllum trabeum (strain ATCC 11539 / FP-39264 / Madison 617) TaxID=670483 RepID=S7QP20_GLOTA|nr:uncharacterized protein GLOTRDRAFT_113519 [Gloeophyllum trabeum ATCC 11539]EPQ61052.1 hypothetical protein GLOTRDRAFT_113519 [Gloeophyllum trabeum ATCC 11539]
MLDVVDVEPYVSSSSSRGSRDDQNLREWLASDAVGAYLRGASPSTLIDEDAISVDDLNDIDDLMFSPQSTLTPTYPDTHHRTDSESSALSSSSDADMSEDLSFQYATYPSIRYERSQLSPHDEKEEDEERSLWLKFVKPALSKESKDPKNVTLFGHMHRVQLPTRRRRRSSSTSSTSTAFTKTSAGPKSILARTPSNATSTLTNSPKCRSPPSIKSAKSVKFVDEPTYCTEPCRPAPLPMSPPPTRIAADRPGMVKRLRRSLSKTELVAPERPVISGPFPLWEAPLLADRASCRSSRGSIRSTRSSSRLRTLWARVAAAVR